MMALALEIEFLSGVCYAAIDPANETPDWPIQPDRLFSALVATWAARGQSADDAAALRELEALPAPKLGVPTAFQRTAPSVFVPPNDARSDKKKRAKEVLPQFRSRQARRFPATRVEAGRLLLWWPDTELSRPTVDALAGLARDVVSLGHSTSLTRCRLTQPEQAPKAEQWITPTRWVYPGRFDELVAHHDVGRHALRGGPVENNRAEEANHPRAAFGSNWLLLEHVGGEMPDVRASSLVAKTLRDALMSGYERIGMGDAVPEVVSGHRTDGSPTASPHLAIAPLTFSGFPHADGHVLGYALIPPRASELLDDETFRKVLRHLAPFDARRGRRILTLSTRNKGIIRSTFEIELSPTFEAPADRRSMAPALYVQPNRMYATVTPVVLDRHLKKKGEAQQREIAAQIADACRHIGLPEPEEVAPDKHSALEGAVSACPSSRAPKWMRWQLPRSLASRQLTHATIRFPEPVSGPVLLGAGRFVGMGLCRPIGRRPS